MNGNHAITPATYKLQAAETEKFLLEKSNLELKELRIETTTFPMHSNGATLSKTNNKRVLNY